MGVRDQKISDINLGGLILLVRDVSIIFVISYLCVRLFSGRLNVDFGKLSATELVSLLLAFFSIGLSAAFYFAATNQSNQFYDNVNKFSKDTSELLGRLDEQVKGLGGRQTELKDSIDKYYLRDRAAQDGSGKEELQTKVEEGERNLSKLVSEILDKTTLSKAERHEFQRELKERDAELSGLREKLVRMSEGRERAVKKYMRRMIEEIGIEKALSLPIEELAFLVVKDRIPPFRRDMFGLGFTTSANPKSPKDITELGKSMVMAALTAVIDDQK